MSLLCKIFGCAEAEGFTIEQLSSPDALISEDINERYLATILQSMQGETGIDLKQYAATNEIRITTSLDLPFASGQYNPTTKTVTLEIPVGLEEHFDELILPARRVMYEELDHAKRVNSRLSDFSRESGLSGEDMIDGLFNATEAIARVTAFKGMSEDVEIGSAPSLPEQFGVPKTGEAIYYSVFDPEIADAFFIGMEALPEGELPHDNMELMEGVFTNFYGTSASEWYTLDFASQMLTKDFLEDYELRTPLGEVLRDFLKGRDFTQEDLDKITAMTGEDSPLGTLLSDELESGLLTGEVENLTVRDLLRFKQRHVGTDGPHNPLQRVRSAGDFFREGTPEQLIEALESQVTNTDRLAGFFRRCSNAEYIPADKREAMAELSQNLTTSVLPAIREGANGMTGIIRGTDELGLSERLAVKQVYNTFHDILYPLSEVRVNVHEAYVRGQDRQCTYVDSWGSP